MATHVDDLTDMVGSTLGRLAREATHAVSSNGGSKLGSGKGGGPLSGGRGVMAGMAVAAAAPFVGKAAKNAVQKRVGDLKGGVTDAVGDVTETVGDKVKQSADVPGMAKEAGKRMVPGLGDGSDEEEGGESKDKKGTPGVGKGRRMPIQQAVDIAVPLEVAYNQWTQFEEWPEFMHRVTQVTQEEDNKVSFKIKVWGMSKEFVADIVEQRPDERIQWDVSQGVTHAGVVTFHELAPRLTRVQVSLDVDPGSLIEKAGRGMRHAKRAVRADLARFKAFLEMQEDATGAWRGVIHDGEVVEEHPEEHEAEGGDEAEAEGGNGRGSTTAESGGGGRSARHPARPRAERHGARRPRPKPRSRSRSGSKSS